ncbi:MAG: DUF6010 family protein [Myxococcota bacterium]
MEIFAAIVVGGLFVLVMSALPEPLRQRFNAVFVGGAGAAYLNGGIGVFGMGELVFATVVAILATVGIRRYPFIGLAWMAHVAWDIAHHLQGEPILRFDASSSLGCAVCDTVIAIWFFAGAPSPFAHRAPAG